MRFVQCVCEEDDLLWIVHTQSPASRCLGAREEENGSGRGRRRQKKKKERNKEEEEELRVS